MVVAEETYICDSCDRKFLHAWPPPGPEKLRGLEWVAGYFFVLPFIVMPIKLFMGAMCWVVDGKFFWPPQDRIYCPACKKNICRRDQDPVLKERQEQEWEKLQMEKKQQRKQLAGRKYPKNPSAL